MVLYVRCKVTPEAKEKFEELIKSISEANPENKDLEAVLYVKVTTGYPKGTVKIRFQEPRNETRTALILPKVQGFSREFKEIKPLRYIVYEESYDDIFCHGELHGPDTEVWLKGEDKK